MRVIAAGEIDAALTFPDLIEALRQAFRADIVTPLRHHHEIVGRHGAADATLLLMPAWMAGAGGHVGVKVVSVFPRNAEAGLPSVMGTYLLMSAATGEPLAVMDGRALTLWRTACASALAASYLAPADAARLVMVGAGALAPYLIRAHAAIRPIRRVRIWNRTPEAAERLAAALSTPALSVEPTDDLEGAVREADIVSCATLSSEPLIRGAWLRPGCHLDLVGAFRPSMRESDDEAVRRARIFVDTREGALKEAGDLAMPLAAGIISETDVAADLFELTRGEKPGREGADEITLFKSVGTAIEDLAAARLVFERS